MPDPEAIPDLERAILELLARRDAGATICPSEAARAVSPDGWRPLMQPAREAASNLAGRGRLEVVQGGRRVDPAIARGPVRLRLVHPGGADKAGRQAPGST